MYFTYKYKKNLKIQIKFKIYKYPLSINIVLNVLVIDDNHYTSAAIADYCNMRGIQCRQINEGKKGMFEIQKRDYDLIILDVAMPEYTGLDILSQLKKQRVCNQNIIILTGTNLKPADFEIYKEVGIIKVLSKPVSLVNLDQIINRVLYFKLSVFG